MDAMGFWQMIVERVSGLVAGSGRQFFMYGGGALGQVV
jgi:hypothetical protein